MSQVQLVKQKLWACTNTSFKSILSSSSDATSERLNCIIQNKTDLRAVTLETFLSTFHSETAKTVQMWSWTVGTPAIDQSVTLTVGHISGSARQVSDSPRGLSDVQKPLAWAFLVKNAT